ncbi:prevent-host-death family protein [Mycobacteroides abscessus]|uniref:type II toxin-antitoxin system Phd/YefM family antitoxin n=1 Tax=Mycobacteroides abscessus TaxID=36809 RepID=UPI0002EB6478|nr:type II toxin-antitoxin system prevent-host-death family antitoxin [Mycobacteroides abscessus]MBN7567108.1 type II toxin-antitoxin system Phd/YefM family antitoxin [Mycobacteroides abscessus subsp. massiliense]PVA72301.1 prevent-host-death family protein [Mycobacteroides abscessus]RIS03974.1 prevent-host-death family protein [Mycobacteroides abscessus]RIS11270.1 prevent-host-death family protein [Mycobacteroides abscessus]RIS23626.1 prevent-host-death family protein [Mycobacteroides abscess
METIGIRELRQNASPYLARVEAGETLGVTNNGRLVARLVPVEAAERTHEALVGAGVLVPASRPTNLLDITATPRAADKRSLTTILRQMRDEQ